MYARWQVAYSLVAVVAAKTHNAAIGIRRARGKGAARFGIRKRNAAVVHTILGALILLGNQPTLVVVIIGAVVIMLGL